MAFGVRSEQGFRERKNPAVPHQQQPALLNMATALTTVFTPAASCSSVTSTDSLDYLFYGWDSNCWPSSARPLDYFSPAICPSGYYSACSLESTYTYLSAEVTLKAGEFGHRCCPSGYTCIGPWQYRCGSTVSPSLTVPYFSTISPVEEYRSVKNTIATQTDVLASAILVKYKAADVTLFPESVATTLAGFTSLTATISPTTTAQTTTSPPPAPVSKGGISQGTKIAIGVAVPIVVLSLVAVVATIYFFRRRQSTAAPVAPAPIIQYVVAAPPAPLPQSPILNSKTTYHYQPPTSPTGFERGPAPGHHEMVHEMAQEEPGYRMRQDGIRS